MLSVSHGPVLHGQSTHLPVISTHIGQRNYLGKDGAQSESAEFVVAVRGIVKVHPYGLGEEWALVWGRHNKEFGDLERGLTLRTRVAIKSWIGRNRLDLCNGCAK